MFTIGLHYAYRLAFYNFIHMIRTKIDDSTKRLITMVTIDSSILVPFL